MENKMLQAKLREVFDVQLGNQRSVWDMQPNGTYVKRTPAPGDDDRTVQEILIERAEKRLAKSQADRKKLKKQGKSASRKRN